MKIAVIDGMGGGLGSRIIEKIQAEIDESCEIIALGTNSRATSSMIEKGAHRGATGENSVAFMVKDVDIVVGPLGIIIPNSMLGEITPAMAEAVAGSSAEIFLLGIKQPHVNLIGVQDISLNEMISELITDIKDFIGG